MNPTIYNSLKFIEQNVKDDKSKKMLEDVYDKYGFYYMLSCLGDIVDNNDIYIGPPIEDENYVATSFVDVDFNTNDGSQNMLVLDTLRVLEFSSIRYIIDKKGSSSVLFRFVLSPYYIDFNENGIVWYDGTGVSTYYGYGVNLIQNKKDIQFNFGYTLDRHLVFEIFVDGDFVGMWDFYEIGGSFSDVFAGSSQFRLGMTGNSSSNFATISFYLPTSEFVSADFLNKFST